MSDKGECLGELLTPCALGDGRAKNRGDLLGRDGPLVTTRLERPRDRVAHALAEIGTEDVDRDDPRRGELAEHLDLRKGAANERAPLAQQLPEDDGARVDVGPRRHHLALHLLGRHVAEGASDEPGAALVARARHLRHTEVGELDAPIPGDENVRRIHVAMNHGC